MVAGGFYNTDQARATPDEGQHTKEKLDLQLLDETRFGEAENAYLRQFHYEKSKTLPGTTAAAHGDPNGKNDYQRSGKKRAERFLSKTVIAVRTDGGLEFCNKDMDNFLTELGIKHEVTNSYTPEMNGVAERFNLTALDGIKTLLKSSEVPHKFWGEALLCFTYAWNRICHKDGNKTPFEKYSGRKPSVLHLKPFGCLAYAGVPKQIRKKFDMRAKMGIMMGYAQRTKGYRIWLIDENKLVETINVDSMKDDSDRVKDSLTSRLVSKTSTETPSTSEKPDVSSDNHSLIPCTEVKWIRNIGYEWVGWKNDSGGISTLSNDILTGTESRPIEIIFTFDVVRNFSAVYFYCNNMHSRDVQVFSSAKIWFSIGGRYFHNQAVQFSYLPDLFFDHSRNVTIFLHHGIGRVVKIELHFAARWLLLSEVSFDSGR
ncbi:retrovirus-related Pol polyprotein from transposon TNT 1-94 [Trichonephila clavipes]|nr:retrovirus-related Pol polyprotein from transposon TNT 1-94 [Trichonephila clavipes]